MREKFGIEIETISKQSNSRLSETATGLFGTDRVDSRNFHYHGHNINKYGFEHDGSINATSNHPYGVEIITPPLKIHQLGEIRSLLSAYKGIISSNRSCGLHVHFEVDTADAVKNVLLIWRRFEKEIVKIFPVSRRNGNRYCNTMSGMRIDRLLQGNFDRYHMVNVSKWNLTGTVEFRGHGGTVNFHKIKRWVFFLASIIRTAKAYAGDHDAMATRLRSTRIDMFEFLGMKNTKTEKYFNGRVKHFQKRAA